VTRPGLAVLVVLAAAIALLLAPDAEAQGRGGHGGGRGRPAPQPDQPSALAPGEYSLDPDQVLEAVDRGEGRQALAYYERVAAEAERAGDRLRAARAGSATGVVALRLGLFQKAIRAGTHSIELYTGADASAPLAPADLGRLASVYSHVGAAYRQVGDLSQARKVLEEGLAFCERRLTGRREGIAAGFLSKALAAVAYAQHDYQSALKQASDAAQFFQAAVDRLPERAPERLRLKLRRQASQSLIAVGRAQAALGDADKAEGTYDRALKYARLVGLRELELEAVQGQGALALSRHEWAKAVGLYEQGLTLANHIKRSAALMWLNYGLSGALSELGRNEEALAAARAAVREVEELRGELGDSDLRSGFLEDKQSIYQRAVRLALRAQRPDEAFELAERSRARALLDLLGNQTTLSKGRTRALLDEEGGLRARLAEAEARAQESSGGEESEAGRALVEAASRDYRAFLERVRKESLEQASLMTVEPVTLGEIQGLLPEGTTLLEYLVGKADVILWIVDRHHATVARIPVEHRALVAQVRRFRHAISSQAPIADVQTQAEALYHLLLPQTPLQGDRLVIVPHGVLHYLPFAALRSPAGRWLVEDFALATLPSASVLRYLADKAAVSSQAALVVGNPDVGAGLALRWAEREARMVAEHEAGAKVLVRAEATEERVKKLLETAGLVHFATHAELNESDPLSSALLLVPGGGEDGRLEVRELFGLDLHARLVVLSACETGLGKLSAGDELVGFQRALIYAGTPAIVSTLWRVDDRASYELVRAFYERLDHAGPIEALRESQMEAMRAFPHPFAWAAFGLTGLPR
jgi:CHAT domain-containing protein